MTLSAQTIRRLCVPDRSLKPAGWAPMLSPFNERTRFEGVTYGLGPASYDVRVAESLILDPSSTESVRERHPIIPSGILPDVRIGEPIPSVTKRRGRFVLASTIERFHMPNNVCATVRDKSTWARRGIAVQNTFVDPGFRGTLTLEISVHGPEVIFIPAGSGICQIVFEFLDEPTEQPYEGKYQDQKEGAQPAIMEKSLPAMMETKDGELVKFTPCTDCTVPLSCQEARRCLRGGW